MDVNSVRVFQASNLTSRRLWTKSPDITYTHFSVAFEGENLPPSVKVIYHRWTTISNSRLSIVFKGRLVGVFLYLRYYFVGRTKLF